jgi:hypothetical protein
VLPWKWNREAFREIDHSPYEGHRDSPFRSRVVADCSGSRLAPQKEANPSEAINDSFMDTQKQKEISQEIELYTANLDNHVAEKTDNSWAESDAEMNHRATRRELSLCVFMKRPKYLWRLLLVIGIVGWSFYKVYPPVGSNLAKDFQERAVNRDATYTNIVEHLRKLDQERPGRVFANLVDAVGTNDIARYFPYAAPKDQSW